ncbi:hypothetical protein ACHAW5_004096 [Stephanodiscus triporus]|uniref:PiggyBac transposable element-derived protein domain-containing protein n=1 Tax=Stephanodiscus triporus TaxID=2934178 RepID=A0ABD3NSG6_9STRA
MPSTFLQGTIVGFFDGRAPGGKNAVWKLTVHFEMPSNGAEVELKRGSSTYLPNAEARAAVASAAAAATADAATDDDDIAPAPRVSLSPAPLIAAPADDDIEIVLPPPPPPAKTKTKRKRKKAASHDDASTATPPPPTAPAVKKSKASTKKKKASVSIDLREHPVWVVPTDGKKHRVVAIAHEQKWVAGVTATITGDVANEHTTIHQCHGMSSEQYRWMLVDDFVDNINEYRARTFVPGGHLEADESMIRWYGVGGSFVEAGIPHYAAIERKPDNGAEIQNLADVASGIMLRLKIVKSAAEEEAIAAASAANKDNDEDVAADEGGKGTRVLWSCGRLVTADAYFASVEAAVTMKEAGLVFIGNVKQCSRRFPMEVLGNATLPKRGCRSVLASINDDTARRNSSQLPVDRNRDHRGPQPKAIARITSGAGTIDRHNRIRADELRLDRNLGTKHWDKRFNLGVLGIICVDTYLFFQQVVSANNRTMSCLEFFGRLADELVDNPGGFVRAAADPGAGGNAHRGDN